MSSQVERGAVREMVHTIAFRAGVLERILKEPVLGSLEIRTDELAHVQLLQRNIDDLRRYLNLPSAEPERTANVIRHDACVTVEGLKLHEAEYFCGACKKKVLDGDEYCSHCGARLIWDEDIPMEYFESGGR